MQPAPTWRLLGLLARGGGPGRPRAGAARARALRRRGPGRERAADRRRWRRSRSSRSWPCSRSAGVPLDWTIHLRVAVTANGIGEGLSTLPGILVPYNGINEWARTVIVLGAAVLLLDAAMLLAFAPPALGDIRRAGAALPLIALVVVPATLVHPKFPYLQGARCCSRCSRSSCGGSGCRPTAAAGCCSRARSTGAIGDGRRPRARPALAVDRLRGAHARVHARARGPVRLDAALRAADLAADRQHRARSAGVAERVHRGVLEDREPRHFDGVGLGRGRASAPAAGSRT